MLKWPHFLRILHVENRRYGTWSDLSKNSYPQKLTHAVHVDTVDKSFSDGQFFPDRLDGISCLRIFFHVHRNPLVRGDHGGVILLI